MALQFVAGSSEYLSVASAPVTGFPCTLACWFNPANITAAHPLLGVYDGGGSLIDAIYLIASGNAAGDPLRASVAQNGSFGEAGSSTGFSASTWQHACGVFTASNSRDVYLNGGSKGSNTTNLTPSGIANTFIGRYRNNASNAYASASVAEAAIWNVALTESEIAALAAGYSPLMIRPDALVAYWPVVGKNSPETDMVGEYNLALSGTPDTVEHPRIIRPSAKILTFPSAGGSSHTLTGAVTHTLTPAATFSINRQHSIAGAVTLTLTPSATFDIDRTHSLSGAVTLSLTPSASMAYTAAGTAAITGAVTYTLTPAATFAINRAYTLTGSVSHTLAVAASMQYTAQQAIEFVGAVTYTLTPQAVMVGPGVEAVTPPTAGWYFPKVKRREWREQSAKERRKYLERLLDAAEVAPEEIREEVEEILESVTGQEDETVNVARIEVARINRLIARIERALEEEDETVLLLLSA